jgi:hypothetical protein
VHGHGADRAPGGHAGARLEEKLRALTRRKALLLSGTAIILVAKGAFTLAAAYYLANGELNTYRRALVVASLVETFLDVVVFVLIFLVFHALSRLEHESQRLQLFMDNMYRRTGRL